MGDDAPHPPPTGGIERQSERQAYLHDRSPQRLSHIGIGGDEQRQHAERQQGEHFGRHLGLGAVDPSFAAGGSATVQRGRGAVERLGGRTAEAGTRSYDGDYQPDRLVVVDPPSQGAGQRCASFLRSDDVGELGANGGDALAPRIERRWQRAAGTYVTGDVLAPRCELLLVERDSSARQRASRTLFGGGGHRGAGIEQLSRRGELPPQEPAGGHDCDRGAERRRRRRCCHARLRSSTPTI